MTIRYQNEKLFLITSLHQKETEQYLSVTLVQYQSYVLLLVHTFIKCIALFTQSHFFLREKKKRAREKYEKWKISRRKIPFDMWEIFTHFLMQFWTTYTLLLLPFSNKQALMEMISTHVHSQKSWKKNFIFVIFISNKNCQESFTMNSQCRDDNALRGITLLFFSFSSLLLLFPCHVHQCHQLVLILNQKKNLFWHQCTWSM